MKTGIGFKIKRILAWGFDKAGINQRLFKILGKRDYIRILNYHGNDEKFTCNFRRQLQWYKEQYVNVSYDDFVSFLNGGKWKHKKPGLMITFDDGFESNFAIAKPLLDEMEFTGYFFVSSDLVGQKGYMNEQQIITLKENGHVIGSHTATHHRMEESDSLKKLEYEISDSKRRLEDLLGSDVDIFCWCGGEEVHYTRKAEKVIEESGYRFGFMTNSKPVYPNTDRYHIQRVNIEDWWPLYLVKFQVSGFMDFRMRKKRERVNVKTTL